MEILLQFMTIDAGPCPRWLAGDGGDCHTVHDGEHQRVRRRDPAGEVGDHTQDAEDREARTESTERVHQSASASVETMPNRINVAFQLWSRVVKRRVSRCLRVSELSVVEGVASTYASDG
jgi:hypothetical protein